MGILGDPRIDHVRNPRSSLRLPPRYELSGILACGERRDHVDRMRILGDPRRRGHYFLLDHIRWQVGRVIEVEPADRSGDLVEVDATDRPENAPVDLLADRRPTTWTGWSLLRRYERNARRRRLRQKRGGHSGTSIWPLEIAVSISGIAAPPLWRWERYCSSVMGPPPFELSFAARRRSMLLRSEITRL